MNAAAARGIERAGPVAWTVAVALSLYSLAPSAQARDRFAALDGDARILAFGDSLTDGVGGSGVNYPERLAARIGRVVINAGSNGETTAQGRARLPGVLRQQQPALMILCLGNNDLLRGVPRERIRENVLAMLDAAREARVPVLLLALPVRGNSEPDPLFAEAALAGGAVVDDRSMVDLLGDASVKADLVHLNAEGYRLLAERLDATLRARGALPAK